MPRPACPERTPAQSTPRAQSAQGAGSAGEANDPFPPVEKVRDGLWSIPVPLPNNSLRYVLVYVFETDRGPYLMDAGWNTDDAFAALAEWPDRDRVHGLRRPGDHGHPHPP